MEKNACKLVSGKPFRFPLVLTLNDNCGAYNIIIM